MKKIINKLNFLVLLIILIFFGSKNVLASDSPTEYIDDYHLYKTENNDYTNELNTYVPSLEECAVTEIINSIKDTTKREKIYEFWVTPAFGISGYSMNDPKIRELINSKIIDNYLYLSSLPNSKLENEFCRINDSTYKYFKSIPGLEVDKL